MNGGQVGQSLTDTFLSLMEQSKQDLDLDIVLALLSSLNLLGILSILNQRTTFNFLTEGSQKQSSVDNNQTMDKNQMINELFNMLNKPPGTPRQQASEPSLGGYGGLNPAMLFNLLASQSGGGEGGRKMNPALLFSLLSELDKEMRRNEPPPPVPSQQQSQFAQPVEEPKTEIKKNNQLFVDRSKITKRIL